MSRMFCLFPLIVLDKPDLKVFDVWMFSELAILDWFFTCLIKHARVPVHTFFHWIIYPAEACHFDVP